MHTDSAVRARGPGAVQVQVTDLETRIHATETERNQGQGAPLAAKQLVVSGAALGAMESGRTAGDLLAIIKAAGGTIQICS